MWVGGDQKTIMSESTKRKELFQKPKNIAEINRQGCPTANTEAPPKDSIDTRLLASLLAKLGNVGGTFEHAVTICGICADLKPNKHLDITHT